MRSLVFGAFARLAVFSLLAIASAASVTAASYLPLSDADLAERAPLIVRARVLGRESSIRSVDGQGLVFTRTTLSPLEALKGNLPSGPFEVDLPGGEAGSARTWFPGTPEFAPGSEVVLFLSNDPRDPSVYRLTELGLSKFDVVSDADGRRFAVRPAFSAAQDDLLSRRAGATVVSADGRTRLRDAESFLAFLRMGSTGGRPAQVVYAAPRGGVHASRAGPRPRPLWVNIGGVENATNELYRWFWDTGASPDGIVSVVGRQTNLSDGSDGPTHIQNAAAAWSGVADSDVRYRFSASPGNVVVHLDVDDQGSAWSTPLGCDQGGVVGFGGPGASPSAPSFRGDRPYFAIPSGTIWVRRLTGAAGCYPASLFEAAVLHEMGHTLGLGHPDETASVHSALCPFATCTAVMRSTLTGVLAPQADDIAAIQWYYGAAQAPPIVRFTAPSTAVLRSLVAFTDASSGNPTSWSWTFGDGGSSTAQNPTHAYSQVGTYTVALTAANGAGSSTAARTVTVVSCSAEAGLSCRPDPEASVACCRVPRSIVSRSPR